MPGSDNHIWIVSVAYIFVAIETFVASRLVSARKPRFFWAAISAALLLLGVAKQLRLQGRISDGLRTAARQHHLYQARTAAQILFIILLLIAVTLLLRWGAGRIKDRNSGAAAGALVALVGFILVRAVSLHALDAPMTMRIAGMPSGWWLEVLALLVIAGAAASFIHRHRSIARRKDFF